MNHIRNNYKIMGVDDYYRNHKTDYNNPHITRIQSCLDYVLGHIKIDSFLDLSCGNGEVSLYLHKKGILNFKGSDPYFSEIYVHKTDRECFKFSFQDIANKGLPEKFNTIICSYALHLCPKSYFNDLLYQLANNCKYLVIISPSKYPTMDTTFFDLVLGTIIERTHCRIFISKL